MAFVCDLRADQFKGGRLFLHDHPAQASAWDGMRINEILEMDGVTSITMGQCQLGQEDKDGNPIKTPTRWMSNSIPILQSFSERCTGQGGGVLKTHTPLAVCSGRTARDAAIYFFKLCNAILEGLGRHLASKGRNKSNVNSVMPDQQ